jgi:hypothetical protein
MCSLVIKVSNALIKHKNAPHRKKWGEKKKNKESVQLGM